VLQSIETYVNIMSNCPHDGALWKTAAAEAPSSPNGRRNLGSIMVSDVLDEKLISCEERGEECAIYGLIGRGYVLSDSSTP